MASFSKTRNEVYEREQRRQQYADHFRGLTAFERHKMFVNDYVRFYGGHVSEETGSAVKTDLDVLRDAHRFIRTAEDDEDSSWEQRLAKKYYDKLFKEYCVGDLSLYKQSKIGMRWRTEKEVVEGKGQFVCGAKGCDKRDGLHSYEVNFSYSEAGERKQALVKLRVCPKHAYQLNYKKEKELEKQRAKESKREDSQNLPMRWRDEGPKEEQSPKRPKSDAVKIEVKQENVNDDLFEGLFP